MGEPADEPVTAQPEPRPGPGPTEEVIQERRRRMAALAAETQAMIDSDRLAREAEAPAAWLYLNALIKADPALAAACEVRKGQMVAAGISSEYLLEELLVVAEDYRCRAGKGAAPLTLEGNARRH